MIPFCTILPFSPIVQEESPCKIEVYINKYILVGIKIEPNELGVSMSSPRIVRFYNMNPKVPYLREFCARVKQLRSISN